MMWDLEKWVLAITKALKNVWICMFFPYEAELIPILLSNFLARSHTYCSYGNRCNAGATTMKAAVATEPDIDINT